MHASNNSLYFQLDSQSTKLAFFSFFDDQPGIFRPRHDFAKPLGSAERDTGPSPPFSKHQPCAPQRKHPFQIGPQHPLRFAKSEIQPQKGHFRNLLILFTFAKKEAVEGNVLGAKYTPKFRTAMKLREGPAITNFHSLLSSSHVRIQFPKPNRCS